MRLRTEGWISNSGREINLIFMVAGGGVLPLLRPSAYVR
jgi:hypothetical protein